MLKLFLTRAIIWVEVMGELNKKLTSNREDYIRAIHTLEVDKGCATTSDISSYLGVNPASVTEMIQKLHKFGFVTYERYKGVALTKKGRKIGKAIKRRHETLSTFLILLGIDREVAERDAYKIEHDVDSVTLEYLTKFVQFIQGAPHNPKWLKHFKRYIKTGERLCCDGVLASGDAAI